MFNDFNKEKPMLMHIDLNSAFATAEQQAHKSLRGIPMGVTNRISKECCVIAASYEAKALGIKVGVRRSEAEAICKAHGIKFVMLETDPARYRDVYMKLNKIMASYSPKIKMKSIDEGIIDFHGLEPILAGRSLQEIGYEIKQRVKDEIGDYMRINIGIGPNRFLAKEAAGWHKPDGLDTIDYRNLIDYYKTQELTDLCGIAGGWSAKLNAAGIRTTMDFLEASERVLKKQVFRSINGTYWYRRLRGYEVDDYEPVFRSAGRQWVIDKPSHRDEDLLPCLAFLSETTGRKLRYKQAEARGIGIFCNLRNGEFFQEKRMYKVACFSNQEIWRRAMELFNKRPSGAIVQSMGIWLYGVEPSSKSQLTIFDELKKEEHITDAMDGINDRYGMFAVHMAVTTGGKSRVKQKIPFGGTDYFELLLKRA